MRRLAIVLFALGVALITHGITRWATIGQFATPDPLATEGDPRFYTAFEYMLFEVVAGGFIICLSDYIITRAKKTGS